jgi:uncharacterized membrane protein
MPEKTEETNTERSKLKSAVGLRSFRGRLFAGVLIIIPLAVTAFLMHYVYTIALNVGAKTVNSIFEFATWAFNIQSERALLIDPSNPDWKDITMAIGLTLLLLYVLGWLGSNVVGRRLIEAIEALLERIPLVDTIYGAIKRMVGALSGAGKVGESAKRVVLVEFPHENMLAIAFMTNTLTDLNSMQKLATVYVPTTPNPTSGYMEIVPMNRITRTDWTMEEALSMILSGGATAPPHVRLEPNGMLFRCPDPGESPPTKK